MAVRGNFKQAIAIVSICAIIYTRVILKFVTDSPVVDLKILEQSQVVPYGKTVTLQAEIKGCSAPLCIWKRETNGNIEKINSRGGKFLVENLDASCQKLTIENFDFSDKGKYSISVTNSVVTVSASLELKLEGKQFFLFQHLWLVLIYKSRVCYAYESVKTS